MRKEKRYNIVLEDNETFILVSCPTKELAEKHLKEMYKTDKYLKEYYNWKELPKYKIVESESVNYE